MINSTHTFSRTAPLIPLEWIFTHFEHTPTAICMQQQFSLYAGDPDGRRCRIRRRRRTYFCVSYSTCHPARVSDPINHFICTTPARISRQNYSAPIGQDFAVDFLQHQVKYFCCKEGENQEFKLHVLFLLHMSAHSCSEIAF